MKLDALDIPSVEPATFYWVDLEDFEQGTSKLYSVSDGWGSAVHDYEEDNAEPSDDYEYFDSESDRDYWLVKEIPKMWKEEKKRNVNLQHELSKLRRELVGMTAHNELLKQENSELLACLQAIQPIKSREAEEKTL